MGIGVTLAIAAASKILGGKKKKSGSSGSQSFPSLVDAGNARPKASDLFKRTLQALANESVSTIDSRARKRKKGL